MRKLLLVTALLTTGCVGNPYKSPSLIQAEQNLYNSTQKLKAMKADADEYRESKQDKRRDMYRALSSGVIGTSESDFKFNYGYPKLNNRSENQFDVRNQMVYQHPYSEFKRIYVYSINGVITSYQK